MARKRRPSTTQASSPTGAVPAPSTRPLADGEAADPARPLPGGAFRLEHLPLLLVVGVVLLQAVWLWPERSMNVPARNDSMFHLLMVRGASEVMASGGNPLDFWIPQLELGFPQFLYYQHLPHLLLAAVHRASFGLLSPDAVFHGCRYLLLVGMPITVLWSMRRMGYSVAGAALAASAAVLFGADNRMGLEYNSYVMRGYGLFSQLVAIHLTFVCLATLWVTLREGRGHAAAAAALAALVLSHLLFGVIIAVMASVLVVVGGSRADMKDRVIRLATVGTIAAVASSYMLLPFVQSSKAWLSTMPWYPGGTGRATRVVSQVLAGELFDFDRLPLLSLLILAGLVAAWRVRDSRARVAATGLLLCTAFYVMRPDSGWLTRLIPAHTGFLSFRFVSAVGVFAVLVIGLSGDAAWRALRALGARAQAAVFVLGALVLLSPALGERWGYYQEQRAVAEETRAGIAGASGLATILSTVDSLGGRIYAGPVTGRTCSMRVGPGLCASDLLNARGRSTVGNPMQSLSLPAGLIRQLAPDPAVYDLFDVRTVLIGSDRSVPSFFRPIVTSGAYALYAVPTSGMAQFVAVSARRATDRQDTLYAAHEAWINAGGARTRETTRWDYRGSAQPHQPRALCPGGGSTDREEVSSQSIRVTVRCDAATADTFAVALKMAFHPHWQVQVDDRPVAPYMVSPGFPAVDVPAGVHRITAHYRAHPAKVPLFVLGLLTLLAATIWRAHLDAPVRWVRSMRWMR